MSARNALISSVQTQSLDYRVRREVIYALHCVLKLYVSYRVGRELRAFYYLSLVGRRRSGKSVLQENVSGGIFFVPLSADRGVHHIAGQYCIAVYIATVKLWCHDGCQLAV